MKKLFFVTIVSFLFSYRHLYAQELFVYTEPASNMAAKSIGIRLNSSLMDESYSEKYICHLIPEVMWGVSKKIMIHVEGFFSNREKRFDAEGGALYMKYRFYSVDEVHSHSRMAAYAKASYNNSSIHQPAIDLNGHNSGYEAGIIGTRLINKFALSASGSFLHALNNGNDNKFPYKHDSRNALGYTISAGRLMLPKNYTDYRQTNLNFMAELLGQVNLNSGRSYLDLAPSVQFIFFSQMRLDIGYRFPLLNDLLRTSNNGFLLRFEYNFFNVYK